MSNFSTACESHGGHDLFVQWEIDTARHMPKRAFGAWEKTEQWKSVQSKLVAYGATEDMIPNVTTVYEHCDTWSGLTRPHGYNDIVMHLQK